MLTQEQYKKLGTMGLTARQMQQVVDAAGGTKSVKSVGGFAGNVVKSGGQYLVDVSKGLINILNPNLEKNTLANLVDLIVDTGAYLGTAAVDMPVRAFAKSKGISDEQYDAVVADIRKNNPISKLMNKNQSNALQDVGSYYKNRYSPENIGETLYTDPVGVLGDVSAVAQLGGGAVSKLGKASNLPKVAATGSKIAQVGRTIEPINLATTGISAGTRGIRSKLSESLTKKANTMATKGLGNPTKQLNFQKKYGMSTGEMINKYDLWSRDPDLAAQLQKQTGARYDALISNSNKTFKINDIVNSIDDQIKAIKSKPVLDYQAQQLDALQTQKFNLMAQYGKNATIKATDLLDYRRALDKNIKANTFDPAKSASAQQAALKSTRDVLKSSLDTTSAQVSSLGKQYGAFGELQDLFSRSQARGANRQAFNFTKLGSAGVGGVMAGIPGAIAGFAAEQFVNSPTGTKTLSNVARGVGSNLINKSSQLTKLPQAISKVAPYSNITTKVQKSQTKNAFLPSSKKQKINVPRY